MTTTTPEAFPDVRRADAGTILVSSWIVPAPEVQRQAADLVIEGWEQEDRPDAMLSLTTFLSVDGTEVLNHAQWTDDDSHLAWARARRPQGISEVDRIVPGIERPRLVRYALHRSYAPEESADRTPGVLVTPTFEIEGPDSQRALADAVVGILERLGPDGLLGAHFLVSKDGRRVLNHAEWEDMAAWRRFAQDGGTNELRTVIGTLEGVTPVHARLDVPRYFPHKSLVNIPAP
ncbi:antibiotic biosynthesis monooxygenase [Streptomyces luteocolor]|uniref:antibiotic biosynthesis monooxygenase n=1 Tax=Streptomyces luteocolor TaxID=285500 RepID=UPI000853B279|nr:antibiotic biosynthesis monooxygenase [Streptomyces luteocolor]